MPLTPLQFKLRVTSETERWMRGSHAFLRANPDLAYSETELLESLGGSAETDGRALSLAMFELIYLGGVDARGDSECTYYRYLDPVPELDE